MYPFVSIRSYEILRHLGINYLDYDTQWELIIHVRVITSERFCRCIADEIDDCVVDTIEYDHIKGRHDLNRLSMKDVNKRLQDLPRGITLAVKCSQ